VTSAKTMTDARRRRLPDNWPLILIGLPAAVVVWSGWIGLGELCGFTDANVTGGLFHWKVNICLALPIGVEAYAAYALKAALLPGGTAETIMAKRFARSSAIGALILSVIAQAAYHVMAADHDKRAPALLVIFVSMLPVVAIGMGATLAHMIHAAKAVEALLDARQDRERADEINRQQIEREEAERRRQHDLELERIRSEERQREREAEAAEREQKRLANAERLARLGASQRLGLPGPSRQPSQPGTVSGGVKVVSITPGAAGAAPAIRVPHVDMPDEAVRAAGGNAQKTPARELMWDLWVHLITTQGRLATGAELQEYSGGPPSSSLGRRMAAAWRTIEPARSLLSKGEATG
jgi:hypothetical protein